MSDGLIYLLLAAGIILSGGFVVWAFTAEDRAAIAQQHIEQAEIEAELKQLREDRAVRSTPQ